MKSSPKPEPPASLKTRWVVLAALAVASLILASAAVLWLRPAPPQSTSAGDSGVMRVAGSTIGGPFQLVDHNGQTVSQADFAGKFMLIYFGFTHCPDFCPTELQIMGNAMDELGAEGAPVVPIFITVDPERDTPESIKDYVAAFHPRMIGLTGSLAQVEAAAKAYKVYFKKQPGPGGEAGDDYQVDHTVFVYLMGPDGVLRSMFRHGTSVAVMSGEIRAQLGRAN